MTELILTVRNCFDCPFQSHNGLLSGNPTVFVCDHKEVKRKKIGSRDKVIAGVPSWCPARVNNLN